MQLDVTDDASVSVALASIEEVEDRLDVVVHNAGVLETAIDGPAALCSFDTHAVGIVRVTEAALPLLRRSSNGSRRVRSRGLGCCLASPGLIEVRVGRDARDAEARSDVLHPLAHLQRTLLVELAHDRDAIIA